MRRQLLYLAELPELLPEAAGASLRVKLMEVFGAAADDVEAVRIVSLRDWNPMAFERMVGDAGGQGDGPLDGDKQEADD